MKEIICPVCGDRVEAEPEGACSSCGVVLRADLFAEGLLEAERTAQAASGPEPAPHNPGPEETDEALRAFRDQFERAKITIPSDWTKRLRALAAEIEPSNRMATVIFVDLRGYTRMTSQMTETQLDRLHHWFYEVCTRRVELHGGFVVRLIGDAVYAAFGAPWAFERDAEAALCALLEIREEIRSVGVFEGQEVSIRAGANTGMVTVSPIDVQGRRMFDLFGSTVNLAARLQDRAETWDILISDTLADLVSGVFDLTPTEPFQPRNYFRAVAPSTVQAHKGAAAVRRRQDSPWVGRAAELRRIRGWAATAANGGFAAAHVTGGVGLGKTRLIREGLGPSDERKVSVVSVTCEPHERHNLLFAALEIVHQIAAWAGALRGGVPSGPEAELAAISAALPELAVSSIPNIGYVLGVERYVGALRCLPAAQLREQVIASLVELVREAALVRPWIIFVDDAQWCDRLSWDVITGLAELGPGGLLLLIAEREESEGPLRGAGAPWEHLALEPLPESDMRLLLDQIVDPLALHPLARHRLLTQTEGVPLYLIELARELAGPEPPEGSVPRLESVPGIPALVVDVLQARIDQLHAQRRALLQCGAVLGRRFSLRLIELFNLLQEDLLSELLALKGLRMLRDEPLPHEIAYSFTPGILREVAYHMLTALQRAKLHRAVAEQIERRFAVRLKNFSYDLAFHWTRAGEPGRARPYLKKAAAQAIAAGSPQDALDLIHSALEPSASEGLRGTLQTGLLHDLAGQACRLLGDYDEAESHFRILEMVARETGNGAWLANALYQLGVNRLDQGRLDEALPLFTEATERNGRDTGLWARAHNAIGAVHLRSGRLDEAIEVFLAVAERFDTLTQITATAADAWGNVGLIHWHRGDLRQAGAVFSRALEIWNILGHQHGQCHAHSNMGILEEKRGNFAAAAEHYAKAHELAEGLGYHKGIATVACNRANLDLLGRKWVEAHDHAGRALHAARMIGDRYLEGVALENLALALDGRGMSDEAIAPLNEAIRIGEAMIDPLRRDSARLARAWIDLRRGRLAEARLAVEKTAESPSADLRSWRRTIGQTLAALDSKTVPPEMFPLLEELEKGASLEEYARHLDALLHLCDRGLINGEREQLLGRRLRIPVPAA